MAKKLIVLYGSENTGKTETLNRLIKILLLAKGEEGKIIRAETHDHKKRKITDKITVLVDEKQVFIPQNIEDFYNTFWDKKVVIGYREKRIAIATKGDGNKEIEQSVDFFKEEAEKGCDIFITAIRTNEENISEEDRYKNLTNKLKELFLSLTVDPIQKKMEENRQKQEEANRSQAEELKKRIDALCDEIEIENSSQEEN